MVLLVLDIRFEFKCCCAFDGAWPLAGAWLLGGTGEADMRPTKRQRTKKDNELQGLHMVNVDLY